MAWVRRLGELDSLNGLREGCMVFISRLQGLVGVCSLRFSVEGSGLRDEGLGFAMWDLSV